MNMEFTGERVIPNHVDPDLWNEHFARYIFATQFCSDAAVLDAGCGTGYGSSLLAGKASSLVGIDLAADAVQYASTTYAQANIRWIQGSISQLPFADNSFRVITAFEVIEHIRDWRELLIEARRVLDDRGVLLVSTPNKSFYAQSRESSGPNPYHVHEFEYDDFRAAVGEIFPHIAIVLQNHAPCIILEAEDAKESVAKVEQPSDPNDANFFLAVCSLQPLPVPSFIYIPRAANVLKERAEHIHRLEGELATKNRWLAESQAKHTELVSLHETQTQELKASNLWAGNTAAELRATLERVAQLQDELAEQHRTAVDSAAAYEAELERTRIDLEERTRWALELDAQVKAHTGDATELARCVALLDQAEATVVERTNWALDLQRQLESAQALLAGVRASRWFQLGQKVHLGPELPS